MNKPLIHSLSDRLINHAAQEVEKPSTTLLETIISVRKAILNLCDKNCSARKIADWLEKEKIHISAGTLRNYIARIKTAEEQALADGIVDPDDSDILRIYQNRERLKRERLKQHQTTRSVLPTTQHSNQARHAPSPPTHRHCSKSLSIPRSDDDL